MLFRVSCDPLFSLSFHKVVHKRSSAMPMVMMKFDDKYLRVAVVLVEYSELLSDVSSASPALAGAGLPGML